MFKIALFFLFLPFFLIQAEFTFLKSEDFDVQADGGFIETRTALIINHSDIMATADTKIAAAATKLNVFSYTGVQLKTLKDNQICILINAFSALANKIKNEYSKFKRIRNSLGSKPTIPVDKTFHISINDDIASRLLVDLETAAANIDSQVRPTGSWETLLTQPAKLSSFANTAENIIEIMENFFSMLNLHTNILKLSTEGTLHDDIKVNFFLNGSDRVDFDSLNFISAGKDDENAIFVLEYLIIKSYKSITKQIPVAYYGISLENNYFYDEISHKIITQDIPYTTPLATLKNKEHCLKSVNNKNDTGVILHCIFVKNLKTFDIFANGILFHKSTPSILRGITTDLQYEADPDIFPAFISFNGNLSFTDKDLGKVTVTKYSPFSVQSHSLTPKMKMFLKSFINNTMLPPANDNEFINYLLHDYEEIIINILSLLCLLIILVCCKYLFTLYQKSTTDPNIVLLRIMRQRFNRQ